MRPASSSAPEVVDQLLGAADGEGGHHQGAPPVHRGPDDALDLIGNRRGVVPPVAVGRLDEDVVGLVDRLRIEEDRRRVAADVSREDEAPGSRARLELEVDRGRAEDVPGAPERPLEPGRQPHRLPVVDPGHGLGGAGAFLRGVEGQRGRVLGRPPSVVVRGLLLLEVARVRKHDPREILGPAGGGDGAAEAVLDQPGQVADVVDVGVREGDGVDPGGVDGQLVPVAQAEVLQPLVETAVHQEPPPGRLQQELRAGDRPRGAQTLDGGGRHARGNGRPPLEGGRARRSGILDEPMPGRTARQTRRVATRRAAQFPCP